ncbi:hypothetical protein PO002_11400 [Cupriavidus necator]|uniref:hypothetical protein n=1 Tax=Cupriavidus necator TaxID=106590 RepID=UPI0039C31FB7
MTRQVANTILTTAAIAAACIASLAHAAAPRDSAFAGDKYGYTFRMDMRDVYSDSARAGRFDAFSEGGHALAPAGNERSLSGLDRRGVSADPARKFDVYTDGALAGMDRRGVSAEPSRKFDVYTDGALAGMDRSGVSADPARKFDVYTDGALA